MYKNKKDFYEGKNKRKNTRLVNNNNDLELGEQTAEDNYGDGTVPLINQRGN
jgi:hypothetical protein